MYTLINGEQMNAEHPATFWIPDHEERYNAEVGDLVKIGVKYDGPGFGGERFWVEITAHTDTGYVGVVRNDLVNTEFHGLDYDDEVQFGPEHIIDVDPPVGDPTQIDVGHEDDNGVQSVH